MSMEQYGLIKKKSTSTACFVMGLITSVVAIALYFIGVGTSTSTLFVPTLIIAAIGALMYFISAHAENNWVRILSTVFIAAHAVFVTLAIIGLQNYPALS